MHTLLWFFGACVIITKDQERTKEAEVEDTSGQGDESWIDIAAGGNHNCALHANGLVECWGLSDSQQTTPRKGVFAELESGEDHTCGIETAGEIACWGKSTQGQLSGPDGTWESLSAGGFHNCALAANGSAVCWGSNDDDRSYVPPGETFRDISAGKRHTCGIRGSGDILCWGEDDCDQASPPGGNSWVQISAGEHHTCALDTAGEITCWGAAEEAGCQRIDQLEVPSTDPDDEDEPWVWAAVSAGDFHNCGLTTIGEVWCWGDGGQGATRMDNDYTYVQVDAGGGHTCGLTSNQRIECVGYDAYNQLDAPQLTEDTGE